MRAKHRMDNSGHFEYAGCTSFSVRDGYNRVVCGCICVVFCMVAITHAVHTTLDPSLMLVEAVDAILADARRLLRQLAQNLARVAIMRPRAALPSLSRVFAQAL